MTVTLELSHRYAFAGGKSVLFLREAIASSMPGGAMTKLEKLWRGLSSKRRQQVSDVKILAPVFHRFGLNPKTTQAYLDGEIPFETWKEEANGAPKEADKTTEGLIAHGVPREALQAYFMDGAMTWDELEKIVNIALGDRLIEISEAYRNAP